MIEQRKDNVSFQKTRSKSFQTSEKRFPVGGSMNSTGNALLTHAVAPRLCRMLALEPWVETQGFRMPSLRD